MFRNILSIARLSLLTAVLFGPAAVEAATPRSGAPRKIGSTFARTAPRPHRPGASAAGRGASPAGRTPKGAAGTQRAFKAAPPASLPPSAVAAAAEASYGWTAPSGGTILGPADSAYSRKSEALSAKAAALSAPIEGLAASGDERGGPLGASEESAESLGRLVWAIAAGDGSGRDAGRAKPVVRDLASLEPLSPASAMAARSADEEPGRTKASPGFEPNPSLETLPIARVEARPRFAGGVRRLVLRVAGQSLILTSVAAEPARRLALAAVTYRTGSLNPSPSGAASGSQRYRLASEIARPSGAERRAVEVPPVAVAESSLRGETEWRQFHAVSLAAAAPLAGAIAETGSASPLRAAPRRASVDWAAASGGGFSSAASPVLLLSGLLSCLVLAAASLREFLG